jgi:hypothetical protein
MLKRAENIRLKYIISYIFFLQTVISYPENRGGKGLKEKGKEKAENDWGKIEKLKG